MKGIDTLDSELARDLAQLRNEVQLRRTTIFRAYAARKVCLASPLLLSACREGELDWACWRLQPTASWPAVPIVRTLVRGLSAKHGGFSAASFRIDKVGSREWDRWSDTLILRLSTRAAHMVLRVGGASILTSDYGGRVILPGLLPLHRREELIGARLDGAFEHPAVADCPYVIRSAALDPGRLRTLLDFSALPEEWRPPWARPWATYGTG